MPLPPRVDTTCQHLSPESLTIAGEPATQRIDEQDAGVVAEGDIDDVEADFPGAMPMLVFETRGSGRIQSAKSASRRNTIGHAIATIVAHVIERPLPAARQRPVERAGSDSDQCPAAAAARSCRG